MDNQHNNTMSYTPPPQYDASFASNLQNENQRLEQENKKLNEEILGLQQMVEGYWRDNRELKRMLDKAFDAGFESEDDE